MRAAKLEKEDKSWSVDKVSFESMTDQLFNWFFAKCYLELTFSSVLACLRTFRITSVLGDTVIEFSRSIEVFRTVSFSLSVQSSSNAFSIAAVASGDVSLYKYSIRSSGE